MTLQLALPLQTEIVARLTAALPGLLITAEIPANAPDRYIRIEGFSVSNEESYKNKDRAEHGVTLQIIDDPDVGTKSLAWVKTTSAVADAAMNQVSTGGLTKGMRLQNSSARLDPKPDQLSQAIATLRYTCILNDPA